MGPTWMPQGLSLLLLQTWQTGHDFLRQDMFLCPKQGLISVNQKEQIAGSCLAETSQAPPQTTDALADPPEPFLSCGTWKSK